MSRKQSCVGRHPLVFELSQPASAVGPNDPNDPNSH
jgi:hypothetical protein